ncbi:kinesin-like protein KIN-8B isoform X1 [Henckelia pumila]|uniref:kinesin-like protein KIN-8B isoform X1 n=1 Tax=Henckelia pumila TaxID=405737 RepID=UPI003C6E3462
MVLSLRTIFDLIEKDKTSDNFEVTCSYLEVYNEVIYDLLEKSSGHLELREDPEQGIIVVDLRSIKVNSAVKILELLNLGNTRRKTESTEVNDTSSRCVFPTFCTGSNSFSCPWYYAASDLRIVTSFESE